MTRPRLLVSSVVIERLKRIKNSSSGELLGIEDDHSVSIIGFCVKNSSKPNPVSIEGTTINSDESYNHDIIPHLPANVNAVGAFVVSINDNVNHVEQKLYETELQLGSVLLIADLDTDTIVAKLNENKKYEQVDFEVSGDVNRQKFIHFRVTGRFVTFCKFDYKSGENCLTSLRERINQDLAIKLRDNNIFFFENGVDGPDITDETTVEDLSLVEPKTHYQDNKILVCELLLKNDSSQLDAAPVITHEGEENFKWTNINIPVDALSLVDVKTKLGKLHGIILESVRRNLTLNESWLLRDFKSSISNKISMPVILHFLPPQIGHFITIAYPKKMPEEERKHYRFMFHRILSLPTDRPCFRSVNEYCFETVGSKSIKILSNPHEGLYPSGVVNGIVNLVQGSYDYHHYMQDGINDNGWGCAYRSLQTIISWYRYQGFYSKPIPTLIEIQKALVSYGDKHESFVGSNKWIGSIEVSYVLENLLEVSSRIVRVGSGEEMSMKGGELSHHFKTQGSPVMIGGGVLAHTIIGVDYNKKTGDLKFLVLDPHYTGEEDLSVIQGKGWCGWKGIDFWKKGHFYNMCLPQKPNDLRY